ncbi:transposase-like protein [Clostridiales Family XIII bacterium PM5-7]
MQRFTDETKRKVVKLHLQDGQIIAKQYGL